MPCSDLMAWCPAAKGVGRRSGVTRPARGSTQVLAYEPTPGEDSLVSIVPLSDAIGDLVADGDRTGLKIRFESFFIGRVAEWQTHRT